MVVDEIMSAPSGERETLMDAIDSYFATVSDEDFLAACLEAGFEMEPIQTKPLRKNLTIGCDCGCDARIQFMPLAMRSERPAVWTMYATQEHYPVRWPTARGPFTRRQPVQIELVIDNPDTVDALIAALVEVRKTL